MDRVPLSEVQEKTVTKTEAPEQVGNQVVDKTIDEMRDMRMLSLLFGYDGESFDGNLSKAMAIWDWATSDGSQGPDAYMRVKEALRGMSGTKGELINKAYVWTSLQGNIDNLKKEQSVLEE